MSFFVHIIESPSSADLLDGRTEGRALGEALQLAQIGFQYNLAVDRNTFLTAIGPRLVTAWQHFNCLPVNCQPVLHLSMHGNQTGVALSNNDFVTWDDLRLILLPLIRAMQGGLLLCMSSCEGAAAAMIAMHTDGEPTFWALVGNTKNAAWADAAVAYIAFYHLFKKGLPIETCVGSMKVASGDHNFTYHLGTHIQQSWQAFIEERNRAIGSGLSGLSASTPNPPTGPEQA